STGGRRWRCGPSSRAGSRTAPSSRRERVPVAARGGRERRARRPRHRRGHRHRPRHRARAGSHRRARGDLRPAPGAAGGCPGLESYGRERVAEWERAVPLGRLGRPEEVASLIAFLASAGGAYITGTTVVVDGGVDAWGLAHEPPRD